MMKVNGLRRHRYLRKLKDQHVQLSELKFRNYRKIKGFKKWDANLANHLLSFRKTRLVEHAMSYEELRAEDCFSEDELTIQGKRKMLKEKTLRESLKTCRVLEK